MSATRARLDADGKATGKTLLTAPIVGGAPESPGATMYPGPASTHVDLETGKRTSLRGAMRLAEERGSVMLVDDHGRRSVLSVPRDDRPVERPRPVVPPLAMLVRLPLRTRNPLNQPTGNTRVAGIMRSRDRATQRGVTRLAVAGALARRGLTGDDLAPVLVTMTRVSPGRLDPHDGLGASLKGCIDGVADALGIDDGDEARIRFVLKQRSEGRGVHGVEVRVERGTKS